AACVASLRMAPPCSEPGRTTRPPGKTAQGYGRADSIIPCSDAATSDDRAGRIAGPFLTALRLTGIMIAARRDERPRARAKEESHERGVSADASGSAQALPSHPVLVVERASGRLQDPP